MLQMMRDNAGSWIIKILLGVIVLVFIFLGLGPDRNAANDFAAEVNKTVISWESYQSTYNNMVEMYRSQFGGALSDDLIRAFRLREQALEKLISDELIAQEAERQDLVVSNEELNEVVKSFPVFEVDGVFNKERYEAVLAQNGLTDGQFEALQRRAILIDNMRKIVEEGAQVSEGEVEELYKFNNTEVAIRYAALDAASQKGVVVDEAQLEAYYKENGTRYQTEPEAKLAYLRFPRDAYVDQVTVTDDDVARAREGLDARGRVVLSHRTDGIDREGDVCVTAVTNVYIRRLRKGQKEVSGF